MRAVRRILGLLLAGWALLSAALTLFVFVLLRERFGRGGPIPASQAALLLHPLRALMHPVGQMLEKFRVKRGDTVLELGPGPGYFTIAASQAVGPTGRLLCLDLQPEMLGMLRLRLDDQHVANTHLVAGDALNLPLADDSVDAAFLVTVLGEIPDRPQSIAELRRVLKPAAVLSISESLTDPDYMFEYSVRDLCRANGFEVLDRTPERLGYTISFTAP